MEPFHRPLTIACPTCNIRLVRVSQTAYIYFAICPGCLAAGSYDTVVDDPAELTTEYVLPDAVKEFMRQREAK